jgi:hypothetical protein
VNNCNFVANNASLSGGGVCLMDSSRMLIRWECCMQALFCCDKLLLMNIRQQCMHLLFAAKFDLSRRQACPSTCTFVQQ